jgi:tetratricopeptide (TPR) repeat protein
LPWLLAQSVSAADLAPVELEPCPGEPSVLRIEAAKAAFHAGQTAFNEGAYARAVEYWSDAYAQDCTAHALLLNLAMAYELLGRPNEALHVLRLFNRRVPDSTYAESNRKRIARLERAAAEKTLPSPRAERSAPEHPAGPAPDQAEPTAMPLPLFTALAGAVASLAGAALYTEARVSGARAAESCGAPRASCQSLGSVISGERARARAETAGWVTSIGLASVAAGALWYVLTAQHPVDGSPRREGVRLDATLPAGAASLYWNGRF